MMLARHFHHLEANTWIAKPHAESHDDAPRRKPEPYNGPPATIADLKRLGLGAVTVICDGPNCWNQKRVTFDELGLVDAVEVPATPTWRGFRCQKCGSRRVRVSPDWTDSAAQGIGRAI